jgi:glycosyltransferase involved in cell wall biosynthesis
MNLSGLRVAWLFPSLERGFYWQSVLKEFAKLLPQTIVFTGIWSGFAAGYEDAFTVRILKKPKVIETTRVSMGTSRAVIIASLGIIRHLLSFNPHVIFTSAFSIWTVLALVMKPWRRWRVIIAYDGSSPNVDCRDSTVRLFFRRSMVQLADAFITNSRNGKSYLTETLKARESCVFLRPYQIPTPDMLLQCAEQSIPSLREITRPVFLFVGGVKPGKGLHLLLEAFVLLQQQGCGQWNLVIVGDGAQRSELEEFVKSHALEDRVKWAGWVEYGRLGVYFQMADVFVLPTLEDVWGMVILEAMAFGKPIICSKWAGAAEMVEDHENGYVINPYNTTEVAKQLKRFIDDSALIERMGKRSRRIMAPYSPELTARHLASVVVSVRNQRKNNDKRIVRSFDSNR